jgi:site-specific DNA recombinase
LEDFSMTVRENLDLLDWSARRDIIRLMVRRIEIDEGQVEIVFRIPPPPSGGTGGDRTFKSKHRCTGERGADHRLAHHQPAAGQGLGGPTGYH